MTRSRRSLRSIVVLAGVFLSLGAAALLAQDPADMNKASAGKSDGAMPKVKGKKGSGKVATKKTEPARKTEADPTPANESDLKFSKDIAPVLAANCMNCHRGAQKKGQFDLSTFDKLMAGAAREKVILPGNPEESELVLRIRNESASGRKMPPGQNNLGPETIKTIEDWIKSGARLDAGIDPAATLDTIAPSPESRRRAELAKMSSQDRDRMLGEVAKERWKKVGNKVPVMTSGKGVVLFSNLPTARAERIVKTLDLQKTALEGLLGPASSGALGGPEKISFYVFNDLSSYVEFVRTVENREIEAGVENHGKLTVEQPYVAAADPLAGKDEPASMRKAPSRKSSKAKKGAQDDLVDGPDRKLEGLLCESLASAAVTASGKPPKWLISGLGAYFGAMVDNPGSHYYQKLREEAAAQYRIGWAVKAPEALGGEGAPETIRAIGFSLCEWLGGMGRPKFSYFLQNMLQGGEKLDESIHACFGDETTREQFLEAWGEAIASRRSR